MSGFAGSPNRTRTRESGVRQYRETRLDARSAPRRHERAQQAHVNQFLRARHNSTLNQALVAAAGGAFSFNNTSAGLYVSDDYRRNKNYQVKNSSNNSEPNRREMMQNCVAGHTNTRFLTGSALADIASALLASR